MDARPTGPMRMLGRGLRKHCPRCGAGHLFNRWFDMKPHCPRCGFRFEREEGFFLGAYVINLSIAEAALGVVLVLLIVQEVRGTVGSLIPWLAVAGALQVAVPIFFYPFSKTTWAAIHLIMHPLEPAEEAEAILNRAAAEDPGPNHDPTAS